MEDAPEQVTAFVNKDAGADPRPLLQGAELDTQSRALFQSFSQLLDHSLIVQQALKDDPPDPDWPDKKTFFTVGEGENQIIYAVNRHPVFDDTDAQIGQELSLLRVDAAGNEETLSIRIGSEPVSQGQADNAEKDFPNIVNNPDQRRTLTKKEVFGGKEASGRVIEEANAPGDSGVPAIEYRGGMIDTNFPVILNNPDGSKTIGGTILTKRQVFAQKGALSQAIKKAPRKDRYYAVPNSEQAASKANKLLGRAKLELAA